MRLTRRDFIKAVGALGLATTLPTSLIQKALAGNADPRVIWLQGQGCSGCSVSLLNTINLTTIDDLLVNKIDLEYHSTLIAPAGELAVASLKGTHPLGAELSEMSRSWLTDDPQFDLDANGTVNWIDFAKLANQGYILVVEGAIPFGQQGRFCGVGGEMTMTQAFQSLASNAQSIIAVGTCAAFGGIPAASPNPTQATSVEGALAQLAIQKPLINIPGCPMHPDWLVGTIVTILAGQTVQLDLKKRPLNYFQSRVHSLCPYRSSEDAHQLGQLGCQEDLGCKGKQTYADCPTRKWNNPAQNQAGVNWCVEARTPCNGCTEPGFPDAMSPFFKGND